MAHSVVAGCLVTSLTVLATSASGHDCLHRMGNSPTQYYAGNVAADSTHAYVLCTGPTLHIFDLQTPTAPVEVGYLPVFASGWTRGITVASGFAYVATDDGLFIVDATTPESPVLVGTLDTPGQAQDVAVVGDLAYVADFAGGLRVVDVANQTAPEEVGHARFPGFAEAVAVVGDYAYVAAAHGGLRVINISQPTFPFEVASYPLENDAVGVAAAQGLAVLICELGRLVTFDVSIPSNPVLLNTVGTGATLRDVVLLGDHAYVASFWSGVHAWDISDPLFPELIAIGDTLYAAVGVEVRGAYVWVADGTAGLTVFDDCWTRLFADGFESGDLSAWAQSGPD